MMRPPSASRPDLVVLGAGIAGLTVALASADRGAHVVVLDQPRQGSASRASAGMLAPSVEGLPDGVLSAAVAARDLYPAYVEMLAARTGLRVALNRDGILEVASDRAHFATLSASAGANATVLDEAALASLESALAGHAGALLHASDGAVDNVVLMEALERAVSTTAGIQRRGADVVRVDLTTDDPAFVTSDGTRWGAPRLLLAGGAWAASLAGLPRSLPVRPVRGQLLLLGSAPVRHVIYGGGGYLVPRGGHLLVGATSEDAGFVNEATDDGRTALMTIAARAVPALANADVVGHWAGLRPMSPDGLPIAGPDPDYPALLYACGYSRNGILFAPWCAGHLAAAIAGAEPPREMLPFSVNRLKYH